jgi:hypothetical protein
LYGKQVVIISDATRIMGRELALKDENITVLQRIGNVSFINYSLNTAMQCGAVQKTLQIMLMFYWYQWMTSP